MTALGLNALGNENQIPTRQFWVKKEFGEISWEFDKMRTISFPATLVKIKHTKSNLTKV